MQIFQIWNITSKVISYKHKYYCLMRMLLSLHIICEKQREYYDIHVQVYVFVMGDEEDFSI